MSRSETRAAEPRSPRRPFEVLAAWAMGVGLPLLEVARRRTDFSDPPAYVDDFLLGALLVWAAWATDAGKRYGRALLAAAWGVLCGGLYYSFFGQLTSDEALDVSGVPNWVAVMVKAGLYAVAIAGLVATVRRGAAAPEEGAAQ